MLNGNGSKKNLVSIIAAIMITVGGSQGLTHYQNQGVYQTSNTVSERMLEVITVQERLIQQQEELTRRLGEVEAELKPTDDHQDLRLHQLEIADAVTFQEIDRLADELRDLESTENELEDLLKDEVNELRESVKRVEYSLQELRFHMQRPAQYPAIIPPTEQGGSP